jgi:hypothetical protein
MACLRRIDAVAFAGETELIWEIDTPRLADLGASVLPAPETVEEAWSDYLLVPPFMFEAGALGSVGAPGVPFDPGMFAVPGEGKEPEP